MNQEKIWEEFWEEHNKKFLSSDITPKEYHLDLKNIVNNYKDKRKIIEIGCGTGITSLLLNDNFDKTLLDCDINAIDLTKTLFKKADKQAQFINADMFETNINSKTYDIVFNSGVIEHFNYTERVKALKEYKRILIDNGFIILAFPNHYCLPYRIGYLMANLLNKWPYPKEYKLYDMAKELKECNLMLEKRLIIADNMLAESLNFNKILKNIFCFFNKLFKFEGYLTVLIIKNEV